MVEPGENEMTHRNNHFIVFGNKYYTGSGQAVDLILILSDDQDD